MASLYTRKVNRDALSRSAVAKIEQKMDALFPHSWNGWGPEMPSTISTDEDEHDLIRDEVMESLSEIDDDLVCDILHLMRRSHVLVDRIDRECWLIGRLNVHELELTERKEGLSMNELSFESCAVSVAEILLVDGIDDAARMAGNFQRNLAHDATKLIQRAKEIVAAKPQKEG